MKTLLLLNLFLFKIFFLFAQDNLLVNFSGQQVENYTHLNFTVRGGITCSGTEVQRSGDSIHFETIGDIPGICGSSIADQAYTFDDLHPLKNQNNFYRINMGQLGNSFVIKIPVIDYSDGILIMPNPVSDLATIFFSNSGHQKFTFTIYTPEGNAVHNFETVEGPFLLDRSILSSGTYLLHGKSEEGILFSEWIVIQ